MRSIGNAIEIRPYSSARILQRNHTFLCIFYSDIIYMKQAEWNNVTNAKLFDVNTVTILYFVVFPLYEWMFPVFLLLYFTFRFEVPIKRHALESNQCWQSSLQIRIDSHTLRQKKKKCDELTTWPMAGGVGAAQTRYTSFFFCYSLYLFVPFFHFQQSAL